MPRLMGDQDNIAANLEAYIEASRPRCATSSSASTSDPGRPPRQAGLLYQVTERFAAIDLHPDRVDNMQMGLVFEELIRRFAEQSPTRPPASTSRRARSSG
jgi:type I restriction enzyme M protein